MDPIHRYEVIVEGARRKVEIRPLEGRFEVRIDGRAYQVDERTMGHEDFHSLLIDRKSYLIVTGTVSRSEGRYTARVRGKVYDVRVLDELRAALARSEESTAAGGEHEVKSPMPGLVVAVNVAPGERVRAGEPVVVVEAMKMQNEITSPLDGVVREVHVAPNQTVDSRQALVRIEPDGGGREG